MIGGAQFRYPSPFPAAHDFCKPIEHDHSRCKADYVGKLKAGVYNKASKYATHLEYIEQSFHEVSAANTIYADCQSLPRLYEIVGTPEGEWSPSGYPGCGGHYPPPRDRH